MSASRPGDQIHYETIKSDNVYSSTFMCFFLPTCFIRVGAPYIVPVQVFHKLVSCSNVEMCLHPTPHQVWSEVTRPSPSHVTINAIKASGIITLGLCLNYLINELSKFNDNFENIFLKSLSLRSNVDRDKRKETNNENKLPYFDGCR